MFESFAAGTGDNQRRIVAEARLPIAVVNGEDEPFVNLDFVSTVEFGNLGEADLPDRELGPCAVLGPTGGVRSLSLAVCK